jgi:hypothetical protein
MYSATARDSALESTASAHRKRPGRQWIQRVRSVEIPRPGLCSQSRAPLHDTRN